VDAVASEELLVLEGGRTHLDAEGFCFVASGDDAAVVVGKHDDRLAVEMRLKDALARGVEIVAVDDGYHTLCMTKVTTPQT